MRAFMIAIACWSGCAALPDDGALMCNSNPARACPDGFQCASDGRCYRNGNGPGAGDMATGDTGDMTGGGSDMVVVEACTTSATCPAGAPVCSAQQMCSACGTEGASTECATYHATTPLCGPNGGCVECFSIDQCESKHQTCNMTTFACAACQTNADCSSGYCNVANGLCADRSTLLYVNNAPTAGCTDTGAGTSSIPFCTIQKGLNISAMNGGKVVVVRSGTYNEGVIASASTLGTFTTTLVGTGKPVIKPTTGAPAFAVAGAGSTIAVSVTLDGFVLDGTAMQMNMSAVLDCNGSSTIPADYPVALVVTNTTMNGGPYYGANADSRCKLTLDRIIIENNASGGIQLDTTDFAITNALIINNGSASSSFGGVYVSGAGESGKMSISNATITGNVASSTGGIGSGLGFVATGTSVINTVIVGNTGGAGEVDTTRGTFSSDAFVGASGTNENLPGNCGPAQLFAAPLNGDFHPKKGGVAPCTLIDVGQTVGAPDHDLDGVSRPQGAAFDVGAYESK